MNIYRSSDFHWISTLNRFRCVFVSTSLWCSIGLCLWAAAHFPIQCYNRNVYPNMCLFYGFFIFFIFVAVVVLVAHNQIPIQTKPPAMQKTYAFIEWSWNISMNLSNAICASMFKYKWLQILIQYHVVLYVIYTFLSSVLWNDSENGR